MKIILKNFYSQKGREKELKKFVKHIGADIFHLRSDFGHLEQVKFFRNVYFPESDCSFVQVNINKHGVIFFWSCMTNLSYRFDFTTKKFLGVMDWS